MIYFIGINVKCCNKLNVIVRTIPNSSLLVWNEVSKSHLVHILSFTVVHSHIKPSQIIANKQLHFVAKSFESKVPVLQGLQVSPKEKGVTGK